MADWQDLTVNLKDLIQSANSYLSVRRNLAHESEEKRQLEQWSARFTDHLENFGKLKDEEFSAEQIAPTVEGERFRILSEQLELSRRHLLDLERMHDPTNFEIVFNSLDSHLNNVLLAGPHGPGRGPRIHGPGPEPKSSGPGMGPRSLGFPKEVRTRGRKR